MNTILNTPIAEDTLAVLYLCEYNEQDNTLEVLHEQQFKNTWVALNTYSEIPNPESQLAMGKDKLTFERELLALHKRMADPAWIDHLKQFI